MTLLDRVELSLEQKRARALLEARLAHLSNKLSTARDVLQQQPNVAARGGAAVSGLAPSAPFYGHQSYRATDPHDKSDAR